MAEESTVKEKPASWRTSARRTDADARISFMGNPGGEEYYSKKSDNHGFLVFAEDAAEGVGDFADGGVGFDGGEDGGEEIFGSGGAALELGESRFCAGGVTLGTESVEASDLRALDIDVDTERGNGTRFFRHEVVHSYDDLFFFLDGTLEFVSRFLDFTLDKASFDGAQHSAHLVDLRQISRRERFDFVGEGFDGVGAGDGVDSVGDAGFVGEDLLGSEGDERGVFGGKCERFVHRIRVQGLAATENGGEGLNRDADDIVFRLLRGERRAGGLRVETEHQGTRIFCSETFRHDAGPETAGGAVFGDFFQKIVVGIEEERKLRGEFIDAEPGVERSLDIGDAIGQREGDFLDGGGAGFADVVTGDGNGVPLGKIVATPCENVRDDAHRGAHGIDIRTAGDILLQNIVLHRAGEFLQAGALPFRNGYIETKQDCGGGVDGHGRGDFFEGDAVEERLHVFEGVDGDTDFADFAESERMVGIHANLRGQIEGDGKTGLALAQEVAVALVGFGGGAEAGVLAHGPEAAAVHGGVDAASKGIFTGITEGVIGVPAGKILFRVETIDGQAGESGKMLFSFGGSGGFGFGIGHGMKSGLIRSNTNVLASEGGRYNFRALRNEVTAKNTNKRATATARPMSQRATSRVQARSAALSQPSARTAKTAPMAS